MRSIRIASSTPIRYSNDSNWQAHFDSTGPEIIEQTEGRLTHFVAGLGTSGTFVGVGRRLRQWRRDVGLISFQPESPLHALEGLKHMASAIVPSIYDDTIADEDVRVATEDALDLTRRLAREEGLLVGPSSGAALAASLQVASTIEHGVIVTIFPDGGDRYLSEPFWEREDRPAEARPALRVTRAALDAMRAHAASTYPEECCGVLLGASPDHVLEAVPLENVQHENRQRRFLIDPPAYRAAEALADSRGQVLTGFYHSHPDHPARPSAFDLEHAWPTLVYPIVAVRGGVPGDVRAWRLRRDRSAFDELDFVGSKE